MRGLSAQSEGEGRGQAVSGRPRLLSVRTDRAGWLCACRVLGGGPAGLGLPAEERGLSGRLCALDGGHVPRPPLRTPLLVGWHHLVPPHDGCLPPRRLCFNQVSGTPAWTMNQSFRQSQTSGVAQNTLLPSWPGAT